MHWFESPAPAPSSNMLQTAKQYQQQLTKPPGSLGQLETIAEQFAAWQDTLHPVLERITVRVFAADHGVCAQGVSAFPQEVTTQMIANFSHGGAAISVLSKAMGADFSVVNMGVANPLLSEQGVVNVQLMAGTDDFSQGDAMPLDVTLKALQAGADQVVEGSHLCIGGEMGIANTTSASAIYCALLGLTAEETVGPGTGISREGQRKKAHVIQQALAFHQPQLDTPLSILSAIGGLEIAGLVGFYIRAAQLRIPSVVDGFISNAAAMLACKINPSVRDWLLFGHESAEPAHRAALDALNAKPIINVGMRLGEGSGAAVAVSVIQSALALHNHMATFDQAGVSNRD